MNPRAPWIAALTCATLAACETTGNPREGGLFGWSESLARERQVERQSHVASAQAELSRETERSTALENRQTTAERGLANTQATRARAEERLRALEARLVAKAEKLEAESPTAATASRARSYRLKVTTIAAQTALPPQQRADRLRAVESEIDAAQVRLNR